MNVAAAYEIALATVIRELYEPGAETVIRCWQNLRGDPSWKVAGVIDRSARCVDIRCAPPVSDDSQINMTVTASIECFVKAANDSDHAIISGIYNAAQTALDDLHYQFYIGPSGAALARFLAVMNEETGVTFGFGGFTFGDSIAPYDDDGYHAIGVSLALHYSRQAS